MDDKEAIEIEIADKLAEYFNDPIDTPCPYCEAAKAILELGYHKHPQGEPPVLSDEEIEKVVNDWIDEDFSVRSIQINRGHWEYTAPVIAQAQIELLKREGWL